VSFLKSKAMISLATATALAGGAGALAATAGTASAATTAAATPRCVEESLSASLHGKETAKGSWDGFILTLTNEGSDSCTLYGYPGLGLENAAHHTVSSHTHWGSTVFDADQGRKLITLSPGETASASFAFRTGKGSGSVTASYLEITPPGAVDHATVSLAYPILGGDLYVTAMATHTPHP
jgi:hypothetical protein